MKVGLMFSGQGSQHANMGLDFFKLEKNKEKIELANKIFGYDTIEALKNLNDELNKTSYTQELMTLMMVLIYDYIKEKGIKVSGALGFSLGEYSALYASGIYSFSDILHIIKDRANFMEQAVLINKGKMVAILNTDPNLIKEVVSLINNDKDIVSIANYNSRKQIVISGNESGINKALEKFKELDVKRMVSLNVSGGFHSELMDFASQKLFYRLDKYQINEPLFDVYLNTTSKVLKINRLKEELALQVKSPVMFYQTIENMIEDGFTKFIEIGPGVVLKNLVAKNYDVEVYNIEKLEDIENIGGLLNE